MGRTPCIEPQCLYKGALYPTFLPSAVSGWIYVSFVESFTLRLTAGRLVLVLFRVTNTVGFCAARSAFVWMRTFSYIRFDTCRCDAKGSKRR